MVFKKFVGATNIIVLKIKIYFVPSFIYTTMIVNMFVCDIVFLINNELSFSCSDRTICIMRASRSFSGYSFFAVIDAEI